MDEHIDSRKARTVILIPARLASSRIKEKPLKGILGKTLMRWTYEAAVMTKCKAVFFVICNDKIEEYCFDNNLPYFMTDANLRNGTERCASVLNKVVTKFPDVDTIVNWQVDEPLITVEDFDKLFKYDDNNIRTLTSNKLDMNVNPDENLVKAIVTNGSNNYGYPYTGICRWFTRVEIPGGRYHSGIYAFPKAILSGLRDDYSLNKDLFFSKLESLEQLDWISWGYTVNSRHIDSMHLSVNSEDDVTNFHATMLRMIEEARKAREESNGIEKD